MLCALPLSWLFLPSCAGSLVRFCLSSSRSASSFRPLPLPCCTDCSSERTFSSLLLSFCLPPRQCTSEERWPRLHGFTAPLVRSVFLAESRPYSSLRLLLAAAVAYLLAVCFFFFAPTSSSLSSTSIFLSFAFSAAAAAPPGINQARREATALAPGHRRRISISRVEKLIGWPRKRAYLPPNRRGSFRFVLRIAESPLLVLLEVVPIGNVGYK